MLQSCDNLGIGFVCMYMYMYMYMYVLYLHVCMYIINRPLAYMYELPIIFQALNQLKGELHEFEKQKEQEIHEFEQYKQEETRKLK